MKERSVVSREGIVVVVVVKERAKGKMFIRAVETGRARGWSVPSGGQEEWTSIRFGEGMRPPTSG